MICPQCGHDNLPGSAFCDTCGYDLNQAGSAPVYTPPTAPAAPVYPPPAAPTAPSYPPPAASPSTAPAMGGGVVCPSCGTQSTTPGALFCDNCGSSLGAGAPPTAVPSWQPAAQPTYQPQVAPTYQAPPPVAPMAGATCPSCHQPVTPGAAFCDTCGTQLTGMGPTPVIPGPVAPPVMPGVMHMRLVVAATGAQIPLAGKQEFLIGREDPIGNVFPDADLGPHGGDTGGVSRKHAKILVHGSQILIEDLNSTNGTWVDKQKVQPGQLMALQNGSEIRLGKVALIFQMS